MDNEQPIQEIKPIAVPAQYFIFGPLTAAFFSLFPGFFALVISNIIAQPFDGPIIKYGFVVFIISFIAAMILIYIKVFKEPEKTTYRIFPNKLEYYEGLFNKQQRTVIFDQVIDVQLYEGLLQQTKGVGTVVLITQQLISSGEGQLSNRRVFLKNVPEPQKVYDLLRKLAIDKISSS
ncbi:MAG: PH domain-containing protein [Sedimentisphaerales bacterium]|nr:PH domain-containing protein [Sedimentisphaerales bacterium]